MLCSHELTFPLTFLLSYWSIPLPLPKQSPFHSCTLCVCLHGCVYSLGFTCVGIYAAVTFWTCLVLLSQEPTVPFIFLQRTWFCYSSYLSKSLLCILPSLTLSSDGVHPGWFHCLATVSVSGRHLSIMLAWAPLGLPEVAQLYHFIILVLALGKPLNEFSPFSY